MQKEKEKAQLMARGNLNFKRRYHVDAHTLINNAAPLQAHLHFYCNSRGPDSLTFQTFVDI